MLNRILMRLIYGIKELLPLDFEFHRGISRKNGSRLRIPILKRRPYRKSNGHHWQTYQSGLEDIVVYQRNTYSHY